MNTQLEDVLKQGVEKKIFPGACVAVVKPGVAPTFTSVGTLRYNDQILVTPETVYDVASITKVIPNSSLALQLIEEGVIRAEDKVVTFLPELQTQYADETTIWHLLTQTLCFDLEPLSTLKQLSGLEILEKILHAKMVCTPGEKYYYLNATSIVLGRVIEKVMGAPINELANQRFFYPLGMQHSTFLPHEMSRAQIAPSEIDESWRVRELVGEVHDESAWQLQQSGILVGSAGLFSTAQDLALFLQMLLENGEAQNHHFFSPETITLMHTNQTQGARGQMGLGWELAQAWMGQRVTDQAFGKTGYTGCCILIDPVQQTGVVFLSNATYPYRPQDRSQIHSIRQEIISTCIENNN